MLYDVYITNSFIHSKLNYYSSIFLSLLALILCQMLLLVQSPKHLNSLINFFCSQISSLSKLMNIFIETVLTLTYKILRTNQRIYIRNLLTVQPTSNTRSSYVFTLRCSPSSFLSSVK